MNAAAEHYPPVELKRPATLKEVEICSRSGLLATDKCYDTVKGPTGEPMQKRTTYMEIATETQMPKEPCNVHGEPRAQVVAATEPQSSEPPRAEAAADLSEVKPIALKGPTLLAQNDPYNSIKTTVKIDTAPDNQTAAVNEPASDNNSEGPEPARADGRDQVIEKAEREASKPVLRAIPVEPKPEETPVEIRRAVPVGPMDEVDDGALLKAATPSPGKPGEE